MNFENNFAKEMARKKDINAEMIITIVIIPMSFGVSCKRSPTAAAIPVLALFIE